jgi:2-dehydropantoate 2-reductase
LPDHRVVAGVVGFNVVMREDATFVHSLTGPLIVEAEDGPTDRQWVDALRDAGLEVRVENPIAPEQWTKLITNLNNAIAALSGAATPTLILTPGYRRLMTLAIDEGLSVLRDAGIHTAKFRGVPLSVMSTVFKLPTPLVRLVLRAQLKLDSESRASMWVDLERRRPTEVDFLNGEIVNLADSLGRDAPINRRLVELVHEAERDGKGSPGLGPDALLGAVLG